MPRRWDVFCRVIDNYGDLGVCGRLAQGLARRGQQVRLWVDDQALAAQMAPQWPGVQVRAWPQGPEATGDRFEPGDVVVEAFGCDPPAGFIQAMARSRRPPVWINLEYLSAEPYVARSHGLPSPQSSGPGAGLKKWFFYPGFTPDTGGLLREDGLIQQRKAFRREDWLQRWGVRTEPHRRVVSVFAYPHAPLEPLLDSLLPADASAPLVIMATAGPMQDRALRWAAEQTGAASVRVIELPWLTQADFDHLLWSCDFNLVRGEDSLVRALWAGKPFLWHIYPQQDGVHEIKLRAFWETLAESAEPALAGWLAWSQAWNGLGPWPSGAPCLWELAAQVQGPISAWSQALSAQPDLVEALLAFVAERQATD